VLVALEEAAGIDLNIVPFSGGAGEAVLATIGGQIDAVIPTAAGQLGLIEAGDLRPIAHTGGEEYNEVLPGAVSFTEAGYPEAAVFSTNYVTVTAPGLDEGVREKLTAAALAVAESDEWAQWCADSGFISAPMAGADLDAWIEEVTNSSRDAIALVEAGE
jgi:tripartite-type tricarboxylate transporter receptor subunit TctC